MMILTPLRSVLSCAVAGLLLNSTMSNASAGPLLDWILGRNVTVAPAYAAGYPVYPTAGYTAGYAPYTAGYAPYTAGYAPAAYASAATSAPYTAGYAPATTNTAVTAYSPATSYPVGSTYTPYRSVTAYSPAATGSVVSGIAPTTSDVASTIPAATTAVVAYSPGTVAGSPYYGTGNLYPNPATYGAYSVPYAAYSTPYTAYSAPAYAPYRPGPIRRLLARLFGHGYRTSYYRAPVTYYRPVAAVSPVGEPTTSLSPCSSYQYQIQRTPTHSLLPTATYPATTPCPSECGEAAPLSTTPGYTEPVPMNVPPNTVIPGAPSTTTPSYPTSPGTLGPDTTPMEPPALGVPSSYNQPLRPRQPNPEVKPIPAEGMKMQEPILPGDRTARHERKSNGAVDSSVLPANWTRISEPGVTQSVARPATNQYRARAVAQPAASPAKPAEKVYQNVNWQ